MSPSSSLFRSRILSSLTKHATTRRPLSSSINTPKQSILAAESSSAVDPPSSAAAADPPPSESAAGSSNGSSSAWRFVKYGLAASLTGIASLAGYATYAYTFEEVDEKTKGLRGLANNTVTDDTAALDKYQGVLYSSAMTVPAKAVELYLDLRRTVEDHVKGFTEPTSEKLLPDLHPLEQHVFTLVLDLNETLVHSDWKRERGWRTFKRPGVDDFLEHLAKFYEIVVFSDEPSMYVDPVIDRLDQKGCIRYRLSRSATKYQDGKHYRDFSKLNRDPRKILYVSGHALESSLQPENGVPIKPWKLESDDTALLDLIPFLEYVARYSPADIRIVLASYQGRDIAKEFIERSKEVHKRMQEKKQQGGFWRR